MRSRQLMTASGRLTTSAAVSYGPDSSAEGRAMLSTRCWRVIVADPATGVRRNLRASAGARLDAIHVSADEGFHVAVGNLDMDRGVLAPRERRDRPATAADLEHVEPGGQLRGDERVIALPVVGDRGCKQRGESHGQPGQRNAH